MKIKLIQAPMAGGQSSQELVAACSAAGALGSFGFAYTQPDEMRKQSAFVRSKIDRAFGINLFVSPQPQPVQASAQRSAPEPVRAPYAPDLEAETVEAIRTLKGLEHAS